MKTETAPVSDQPKHTQGKWRVGFRNKKAIVCEMPNGNIPTITECQVHLDNTNITQEQAEANAERIVAAVNEYDALKKKEGMHDELVEELRKSQIIINYLYQGSTPRGVKEQMQKNSELLKQAEQK